MRDFEPIFSLWPSAGYRSVLLEDAAIPQVAGMLNRERLAKKWVPLKAYTTDSDTKGYPSPDISILNTGGLIINNNFRDSVFTDLAIDLEFLPMEVDHEPWWLVNCLSVVGGIDERGSSVMRSTSGEIFMVLKLRLIGMEARDKVLFTLFESNQSQIFTTNVFRNRVGVSGAMGVRFDEIGMAVL